MSLVALQVEADRPSVSQDVAAQGSKRFLWTGLGFAVLMLLGLCLPHPEVYILARPVPAAVHADKQETRAIKTMMAEMSDINSEMGIRGGRGQLAQNLVEQVKSNTLSSSMLEEAKHISNQVTAIMADPIFQEHWKRVSAQITGKSDGETASEHVQPTKARRLNTDSARPQMTTTPETPEAGSLVEYMHNHMREMLDSPTFLEENAAVWLDRRFQEELAEIAESSTGVAKFHGGNSYEEQLDADRALEQFLVAFDKHRTSWKRGELAIKQRSAANASEDAALIEALKKETEQPPIDIAFNPALPLRVPGGFRPPVHSQRRHAGSRAAARGPRMQADPSRGPRMQADPNLEQEDLMFLSKRQADKELGPRMQAENDYEQVVADQANQANSLSGTFFKEELKPTALALGLASMALFAGPELASAHPEAPALLLAKGGEYGIIEGRIVSLAHPAVMSLMYGASAYSAITGWKWRRQRELGAEIKAIKSERKALQDMIDSMTPEPVVDAEGNAMAAPEPDIKVMGLIQQVAELDAKIEEKTAERKEYSSQPLRDNHYQAGSLILGLGTAFAIEGPVNTFLRAQKLFPGPHLYAGAGVVVCWALAASLVPKMAKGENYAREAHIAFNALALGLFTWQLPTGWEIMLKVIKFTNFP